MTKCTFCGKDERPFRGVHLIRNIGVVSYFCSSKCRKNSEKLKRDKRRVRWTEAFHETRNKTRAKAEKAAKKAGISPKNFVDKIAISDQKEQNSLNISYNRFIRTTDPDHVKTVKEIWRKIDKSGDIYLGEYKGIYCEGCEAYYSKRDLANGRCPFHPALEIKQITEENYFFKWSKYRDFLVKHIESHPKFIIPRSRKSEMLEFAKRIEDIPVSRTNFKWGISVPNNPEQFIYVWFDALTNYVS
mgnify:CR=1 FL=1